MKTIWKFTLYYGQEVIDIEMPLHAKVLHVARQDDGLCIWAEVEPAYGREIRKFAVRGTGMPLPEENFVYIGTAHLHDMHGNNLVLHVMELLDE